MGERPGSESDESGYFVPPPKAPKIRTRLEPELESQIQKMLDDIMFDFDPSGGQCNFTEFQRVMKFVPVYQQIPAHLQEPFSDANIIREFKREIDSDYLYENSEMLAAGCIWH